MSIKKFIGLTSAERRKIERQELTKKVALAVAAAAGVATGILVAPMSGKKPEKAWKTML